MTARKIFKAIGIGLLVVVGVMALTYLIALITAKPAPSYVWFAPRSRR